MVKKKQQEMEMVNLVSKHGRGHVSSKTDSTEYDVMGKERMKEGKEKDFLNAVELEVELEEDDCHKCTHVKKYVRSKNLNKKLPHASRFCPDCPSSSNANEAPIKGKGSKKTLAKKQPTQPIGPMCVCMTCGTIGCNRDGPGQHAIGHAKSMKHPLVYDVKTISCWCYDCDEAVDINDHEELIEAVGIVTHALGLETLWSGGSKRNRPILPSKTSTHLSANPEGRNNGRLGATAHSGMLSRIKGLSNLGNTCFFNAIMQNLAQSKEFVGFMKCNELDSQESLFSFPVRENNSLHMIKIEDPPGRLTGAMKDFLTGFKDGTRGVYNPGALFQEIVKKAPRFRGFQQQDSHELLRYLLDGLHTEELKRRKKAVLKIYGLESTVDPMTVDEDIRKKIKDEPLGRETFVTNMFGGELVSTVTCKKCGTASKTFEPFLDLSLSIPRDVSRPIILPRYNVRDRMLAENRAKKSESAATFVQSPSRLPETKSKHQLKKDKKDKRKVNNAHRRKVDMKHDKSISVKNNPVDTQEEEECKVKVQEEGELDEAEISSTDDEQHDDGDETKQTISLSVSTDPLSELTQQKEFDSTHSDLCKSPVGQVAVMMDQLELDEGESKPLQQPTTYPVTVPGDISKRTDDSKDLIREPLDYREEYLTDVQIDNQPVAVDKESTVNLNQDQGYDLDEIKSADEGMFTKQYISLSDDESVYIYGKRTPTTEVDADKKPEKKTFSIFVQDETEHTTVLSVTKETTMPEILQKLAEKRRKAASEPPKDDQDSRDKGPWPTLSPLPSSQEELSVTGCLQSLCRMELLNGSNQFICEVCTKRQGADTDVLVDATKQILISKVPRVLTLHLKRFEHTAAGLRKVSKNVAFPVTLDLAPYCRTTCKLPTGEPALANNVQYRLFGVVEHGGSLQGGHYVAYAKDSGDDMDQWYYASDSQVSPITEEKVLKSQAFMLFYEKIEPTE